MKVSDILQLPTLKVAVFLYEKGEVRYAEFTKLISSRGTLSLVLKELDQEGLIQRRVVISKPIQTYYTLTDRGREIGARLKEVEEALRKM